jgi:transposase
MAKAYSQDLRDRVIDAVKIGVAPRTILYDRMKTAVIGEDTDRLVVYNRALVDLARHYGFQPRASSPSASSRTPPPIPFHRP